MMSDSSYGSVYVEGVTYIDEREIAKRDAEIERLLQGERAADAEIERLREWNRQMVETAAGGGVLDGYRELGAKLAEKDAEIERLREENSTFSDSLAAKADRIDRLGETVARQVAEIERLRSQFAAMERGYKFYRDTAEEVFVLLQELRSLIRARLAGPRVDYGTTHANVLAWDREWLERAKEMVGDE